jgi:hypothetical protein
MQAWTHLFHVTLYITHVPAAMAEPTPEKTKRKVRTASASTARTQPASVNSRWCPRANFAMNMCTPRGVYVNVAYLSSQDDHTPECPMIQFGGG